MLRWRPLLTGLVVLGAWGTSSCSPAAFQSATVIDTVRILASRASEPRARPGDEVTLDLLAFDGRIHPVGKMEISWLPILCVNPPNDAYYACFASLGSGGGDGGVLVGAGAGADDDAGPGSGLSTDASAGDAGAITDAGADAESIRDAGPIADAGAITDAGAAPGQGLAGLLRPGVDLTPVLVQGPSFRFKVPADVIVPRTGVDPPYGLLIAFNFACAGHIEVLPYDPGNANPQQMPIGCFDSSHNQLGPDDFVFGFSRVYAYDKPTETNPVISQVDLGGSRLDIDGGTTTKPFTVPLCTSADGGGCPKHPIGPVVGTSLPDGKQVWADFYSTVGTFSSGARLLYDPMAMLSIPSGTNNQYLAPNTLAGGPAQNFVWIIVHDDQGGADWVTVPLQIE